MLTKQGNGLLNESCSAVLEKDTMNSNIQHMFGKSFLNKLKWKRGEKLKDINPIKLMWNGSVAFVSNTTRRYRISVYVKNRILISSLFNTVRHIATLVWFSLIDITFRFWKVDFSFTCLRFIAVNPTAKMLNMRQSKR